jgi:hypothetical protein
MIIQGMNLVNFNVTNIDEPHLAIDYIVVAGGGAYDGAGGGGGGGGIGTTPTSGASGGSGTVIVRYPGSTKATDGTITSAGGYTYHTFTSPGTFTVTSIS